MAAADRYCEAIYELAEDDIDALQTRIAERLGVSRAAVSEMTARLVAEGHVASGSGYLRLTDLGLRTAERAVRRHRLAERLLVDVLGLGWAEAHDLAGAWQAVIDERTEPAIVELRNAPTTCPHGNPIPGMSGDAHSARSLAGEAQPLSELPTGAMGRVVRVSERLENEPGMLATLEAAGLIPGTRVEVLSISADRAVAVRASKQVIALSHSTSAAILVRFGDLEPIE